MTSSVDHVATPTLDIEYRRWGAAGARPVLLLHGWPDCAATWTGIAPALASAGHHVLAPSLRGHGGTRFRSESTPRSGQLSALAQDVIDLADALGLERFTVVGHDWGARAAYIASCLWPARVQACVAMSVGWGTNRAQHALPLSQVRNYWYQWYMSTPRGEALVRDDRIAFTRYIWDLWCPHWKIDPQAFTQTAVAFDNPDWADVVLHSYRHRWGWAPSDPAYDALEARLADPPAIGVPTLMLHGADDPCTAPATSEGREAFFSGVYVRELVMHCGHFPQREQPQVVTQRLLSWLAQTS
jgi:pimeloyl-ACP methyl ester carboxylesterase